MTRLVTLPRQTTIYTCGAACLAAVSRLRGGTLKEMDLAHVMHAQPIIGITNNMLMNTAKSQGAENCGENIWNGKQLAVLNILNPISGVGHYVVALRTEDESGDVIVYCPYYANTLRLSVRWLEHHWISGDRVYRKWAITFPMILEQQTLCIGEAWPEMGLEPGEMNPHWLLRSARRAIANLAAQEV